MAGVGVCVGDVCVTLNGVFRFWCGIRAYSGGNKEIREEFALWKLRLQELDKDVEDANLSPGAVGMARHHILKSFHTLKKIDNYLRKSTTKICGSVKWAVYLRKKILGYKETLDIFTGQIADMIIIENPRHQAVLLPPMTSFPLTPATQFEEPVFLVDLLDELLLFSAVLCQDFESLHTLLLLRFKQSKGSLWVEQQRYQITDESTGAQLRADGDGKLVKPGAQLSMAMVFHPVRRPVPNVPYADDYWICCGGRSPSYCPGGGTYLLALYTICICDDCQHTVCPGCMRIMLP